MIPVSPLMTLSFVHHRTSPLGHRLSVMPCCSQLKELRVGHIVIHSAAFRVSHCIAFVASTNNVVVVTFRYTRMTRHRYLTLVEVLKP